VAAVAGLADPANDAPVTEPAIGELSHDIPADITDALRELRPGVTRLDAYHSRLAGTRRIQASILVRPGSVDVVCSAFGVAPERPWLAAVNRDGLRQVVRDVLSDPGGDPAGDAEASTQDGPPYRCPVCGYLGLEEPPRTEESGASYEICPSCGFEFGVTDDSRGISYEQRRAEWVAGGMKWWSRSRRPPPDWDPRRQLRELTGSGPGVI
jgi:hypothetical protein